MRLKCNFYKFTSFFLTNINPLKKPINLFFNQLPNNFKNPSLKHAVQRK